MKKIISVVGPTASGKTALSVGLAQKLCAQIVSVDSMQIYRKMDIGTAKVTREEMRGIPHHMIDCLEPNENCNVQKFVTMARKAVDKVLASGTPCVLAGGTGLYVDHLLSDTKFVDMPTDFELRQKLNAMPNDKLFEMLESKDPVSFKKLHVNDKKRIVRALEVVILTGKSIVEWDALSHLDSHPLDATMIGLNFEDREKLYARIDLRVDRMVQNGLIDEVSKLMQIDGFAGATASAGIGYKEIISYLNGDVSLEDAILQIKQNTRHYAKRQLTWFRRNPEICWINIGENTTPADVLEQAISIIQRS